jgi:hypothetical protein
MRLIQLYFSIAAPTERLQERHWALSSSPKASGCKPVVLHDAGVKQRLGRRGKLSLNGCKPSKGSVIPCCSCEIVCAMIQFFLPEASESNTANAATLFLICSARDLIRELPSLFEDIGTLAQVPKYVLPSVGSFTRAYNYLTPESVDGFSAGIGTIAHRSELQTIGAFFVSLSGNLGNSYSVSWRWIIRSSVITCATNGPDTQVLHYLTVSAES